MLQVLDLKKIDILFRHLLSSKGDDLAAHAVHLCRPVHTVLFAFTLMKVFRIIPEFRILRMTFDRISASNFLSKQIMIASLFNYQIL